MNLGFVIVLVTKVAVIWTSFSSPDDDVIIVVTFFRAFVRSFFCVALLFFFPESKSKHELFRVLVGKP